MDVRLHHSQLKEIVHEVSCAANAALKSKPVSAVVPGTSLSEGRLAEGHRQRVKEQRVARRR